MSDIYSIGLSGLQAAQIGISTTGENISNSSTTGYDVESPVLAEASGQYTSSGYLGTGVSTVTVQRAYSQYVTTALNEAQSSASSLSAAYGLASSLSDLVGSPTSGIGSSITAFFSGLSDVADSPSDDATRETAVSDAQTLADEINAAGAQYDSMRTTVNTELQSNVTEINSYSEQIAQLNTQIASASTSGQEPNQLLDERDAAVSSLSQLIGVQVVQNSSGYSIYLGNGQPLVSGSQSYNLTTQPSSTNPSELTVAWAGTTGSSTTPEPLSSAALTGGTVGGLISFVTGTLDPAESQLGAIATSFAAQVNSQNALGLDLAGNAGGALFSVAPPVVNANSGNTGDATVAATLTDPEDPPTDNYTLSYANGTYTLTDATTNTIVGSTTTAPSTTTPFTAGGLSITSTGTMNNGDSFSIQPTAGALDSFAVVGTASDIAAASPVLVSGATSNTGSATISDATVSSGYAIPSTPVTLTYAAPASGSGAGTLSGFPVGSTVTITVPGSSSPTTVSITSSTTTVPYDPSTGATFAVSESAPATLTGVSFTMSGTPANGDTFTIAQNTDSSGDGSNATAMADLVSGTTFTGSQTLTDAYADYVDSIGNTASQLDASNTSQASVVSQLTSQQQAVSGVNLDEEATNLLQYQQLYQANAQVISTASTLFQSLITAIEG